MLRGCPSQWPCRFAVAACLALVFVVGCANPRVTRTNEPLKTYKKVRVVAPDPDPRKVHPRIVTRLRALGFDVREMTPDGPPEETQGTGFIITDQGHVLTCAHVLGSQTGATLWVQGKRFEADVLAKNTNQDLALLQIKNPQHHPLPPLSVFFPQPVALGQPVFSMGFPLTDILGKAPRLSKGLVSASVGVADDPAQYQISAEVQPGSSGSPLLTEDGQIAGVVVSTLNALKVLVNTGGTLPQNVNFAIKGSVVQDFLQTNGVSVPTIKTGTNSFEKVQESLALVRAGIIPAGEEDLPELGCIYSYISLWDIWFRFRAFEIAFVDLKSGKLLLKAGQYRDNPLSSEDKVLDRTFEEIRTHFFPAQPTSGTR